MPIDPVGGAFSAFDQQLYSKDPFSQAQAPAQQAQDLAPVDKQTFGAAVVSKTLDYMNGQGGPQGLDMAPVDRQTFGAAVVSKTLDYMNSGFGPDNGMAQSYDFNKSVLGGHADAIGSLANIKV